jgi:hypothetical protein
VKSDDGGDVLRHNGLLIDEIAARAANRQEFIACMTTADETQAMIAATAANISVLQGASRDLPYSWYGRTLIKAFAAPQTRF